MARLQPTKEVIRLLFGKSGNQCAFPNCSHKLFNEKNQFIAQICHIEAAEKGGERYNFNSTDEYRRSYENLIILCYAHHVETNDVDDYSVESLKQIKYEHEKQFENANFQVNETALRQLSDEMNQYWIEIDRLNKVEHIFLDLAMEVNARKSFFELINSIHKTVYSIEDFLNLLKISDESLFNELQELLKNKGINPNIFSDIPYYANPFVDRNWELHNLGTGNHLNRLRIDLVHLEIKYLEEYLKNNLNDDHAHNKLKEAQELLREYAQSAVYID
jgi:hypothetical protein